MIFFATSLFAEKVEVDKALKVAQNHVYGNAQLRSAQDEGIKLVYTATNNPSLRSSEKQDETVYYYVFNVKENNGFVIVSGDDIAIPILGYSTTGTYDSKNLPPAFSYWMECLQKEIDYGIQQNIPQSAEAKLKWDTYLQGTAPAVRYAAGDAPLIQTMWNQGAPYNNACPEGTLTGCVATAMAQIMKYHNWPARGTGILPGYTTSQYTIADINLDTEPAYEWNNMLDDYSGNPTDAQKQAVATLMYHCGVSVEMNYGLRESSAITNNIGKALPVYFGYDKGIQGKSRASYTDREWHAMLKTEIDAARPVVYSGSGSGGHAFICDGYDDSNNTFHFNWGWGGWADGYFATDALTPDRNNFNSDQSIIINIKPDEGGKKVYEMAIIDGYNFIPSTTTVDRMERFTVGVPLKNAGVTDFSGRIDFSLMDESETLVGDIGSFSLSLKAGYFFTPPDFPSLGCIVPSHVKAGTYRICAYAQQSDDVMSRTLVKIPIDAPDVFITVNDVTLLESELVLSDYNPDKAISITPAELKAGESINVTCIVYNQGRYDFYGTLKLGLYKDDALVQVIEEKEEPIRMKSISYNWIRFNNASLPAAGNYKLRLYAKEETGTEKLVGDRDDAKNNIDITITEATPVTTYTISYATFTGGRLSVDKNPAEAGETITVTATPHSGYELGALSYYTGNASETTSVAGTGNIRSFLMPADNITLTAIFRETAGQQAEAPVISSHPESRTVTINTDVTLSVTANAPDNGTLTFQWYENTANNANGGVPITGATNETYSPPTATIGTKYYAVVVTNTKGESTATTTSHTATVTVTEPDTEEPTIEVFAITIATMTNGTVRATPASAEEGEAVTLTISPLQGYELSSITARQTGASATVSLSGAGNTRTFTMPAYDVTIEATFAKTQEQEEIEALEKARTAIEGGTFFAAQMVANVDESLRTWLVNTLNTLFGQAHGIQFRSATLMDAEVTLTSVTPAIAGTEENPEGTNGSFTFTVTLTNGNNNATTQQTTGVIIATPYSGIEVKSIEMLNLSELTVYINNTGNVETGRLTFTLSGTDAEWFTLLPATLDNLGTGGEAEIVITPKAALANRKYTFTLTATAEGMEPVSITITYDTSATGTEEIQVQTLQAIATASGLYISGLIPGETFSVYNLLGQLSYKGKATVSEQYINLRNRGIYIITNGNKTVKAIY
jgi:hypothetical protein